MDKTLTENNNIDTYLKIREDFITKVNSICVDGKDYHIIQGKKSLAKGGAEKIASIFKWVATFEKDEAVMDAFKEQKGLIAFICNLYKDNNVVGQGRGANLLAKNNNDANKTIKMAQKSAFIDAVLRASGLSDFFTQDLEDMENTEIVKTKESTHDIKPSDKQIQLIEKLMVTKNISQDDIYNLGFDYANLTGGKEGTASELIDILLKPLPFKNEENTILKQLQKDIEDVTNLDSLEKIANEIQIVKNQGNISDNDIKLLREKYAVRKKDLEMLEKVEF